MDWFLYDNGLRHESVKIVIGFTSPGQSHSPRNVKMTLIVALRLGLRFLNVDNCTLYMRVQHQGKPKSS